MCQVRFARGKGLKLTAVVPFFGGRNFVQNFPLLNLSIKTVCAWVTSGMVRKLQLVRVGIRAGFKVRNRVRVKVRVRVRVRVGIRVRDRVGFIGLG